MSFLNSLIKEANKIPVVADKNAPMLLMIAGISGLAATVVSAIKATPLAILQITLIAKEQSNFFLSSQKTLLI